MFTILRQYDNNINGFIFCKIFSGIFSVFDSSSSFTDCFYGNCPCTIIDRYVTAKAFFNKWNFIELISYFSRPRCLKEYFFFFLIIIKFKSDIDTVWRCDFATT